MADQDFGDNDIAIVGMATRVPGARTISEYWQNLVEGKESVTVFTDEELIAQGESPELLRRPNYVRAGCVLQDLEMFDAEFFGFSPKEAAIMDPQHRHFIEVAWEALENAGHPPERFAGNISIFGGVGMGAYFAYNILSNRDLVESVGLFLLRHTSNDKDFLVTRVAYLLDLKGPAINVQTACSTSLVATHMACQSLLSGESDLALAGGVTIEIPHRRGYLFHEGEVLSPDGHCHAFDHRGQGTIFGSGAGVVVLRRIQDAIDDGDPIHAIIKGSAVNNDGSSKVGYLAPSVDGQAKAMIEAYGLAGVEPETISYIECHGTGTAMGDPIEVSALTQAFRESTDKKQFCRLGSVKTNIGHLDTAAGVAALIKAALSLEHQKIPASLNYEKPNPSIDFENSPFLVNDRLYDWKQAKGPRRAAVNSLGVGGTNAHLVLEEPPRRAPSGPSARAQQLLVLSARTRKAVDDAAQRLADHLEAHPEQKLADVAFTLWKGRRHFDQRRVLAAKDSAEAIQLLRSNDPQRVYSQSKVADQASVVFMFPGGGSQYVRMGRDLYATEPVFKEHLDRGFKALDQRTGVDYRPIFFAQDQELATIAEGLEPTTLQLPAIFILEYALAQLWMARGLKPAALIGHSLGENAAACVAGIMSFEETLGLVILRGKLIDQVAEGAMLSIGLSPEELQPYLGDLDLAIVNGPKMTVVSGTVEQIAALEATLASKEIEARRLRIRVAAHSRMLDPILPEFGAYLRKMKLEKPKIPLVSNTTGTWLTDQQATDPEYWVQHLRRTVRFGDGIETLVEKHKVFLEVGPGRILSSLVRQHPKTPAGTPAFASLRHPDENVADDAYLTTVLGRLWAAGAAVDLAGLYQNEQRQKVELPAYAWQHAPYWITPGKVEASDESWRNLAKLVDPEAWLWRPAWKQRPFLREGEYDQNTTWLIFQDEAGVGRRLADRLRGRGHTVVTVKEGDSYLQKSDTEYLLSPERGREGYDQLIRDLVATGKVPNRIAHFWMVTANESHRPGSSFFHRNQERGFYSLFFLAQALGDESVPRPLHLSVFSNGSQRVADEALPYPEKATLLGPVKVIPRELPGITVSAIDLELPKSNGRLSSLPVRPLELFDFVRDKKQGGPEQLLEQVAAEVDEAPRNALVAFRHGARYEQVYERAQPKPGENAPRLKDGGVYLITGGLGGLGLTLAEHLARSHQAKLVLVGRSALPARSEWEAWIRKHGPSEATSKRIQKLKDLELLGAEVQTAAVDVTDVQGLREVIGAAKQRFGRLDGVIHTAGVVADNLIQLKALGDVEEVFAPKVHGTLVLEEALKGEKIDFLALYSSTSTAIAPAGQIDYVAANCFLNAFADARAGTQPYVVAINWGIWNEVGLAANAVQKGDQPTVTVVDKPVHHPLFALRLKDQHDQTFLEGRYSPRSQWILDEHRTKSGQALLPGTGYLELAKAALEEYGERSAFAIEDLYFFRPLWVADDEPKEVRVRLRRNEGGYDFEVRSRRNLDGRIGWELHAQANLLLGPLPSTKPLDAAALFARCTQRVEEDPKGIATGQERHLRFGPRWRVLNKVAYGQGEAVAQLSLPEAFRGDLEQWRLHPALLDLATGFAMSLIEGYDAHPDQLWVPVQYRKARIRGNLPAQVVSWVRSHGQNKVDSEFASFDITIADLSGRVLLEVDEFSIKRTKGDVDFAVASKPTAAELEMEPKRGADGSKQLSPAEAQLQRNLEQGILPKEGAAAFERILSQWGRSQIIVSSLDLPGLIKQTEATTVESKSSGQKFARPQLDSEYQEPTDEVERTLVGFWEELLGVNQVGTKDSFFDLGGHSLIAVRLFAQIKKAYHVDYPISVLFEAPTIARCASLIKESIGHSSEEHKEAAPKPTTNKRRYTHLVAMHPGEGGPKRPFFLVAGMFGNVLNLRHLAHLIGSDRPFYGLQARGLLGDQKPHETFEEMARDYLEELRTIQPEGPYLLGGFSGGGITAYEMAQQLHRLGQKTSLLVMLDSLPPSAHSPPLSAADKVKIHLQELQKKGPGYLAEWGSNKLEWELDKWKKKLGQEEEVAPEPTATFHNTEIEAAFRAALPRYQLQNYGGKISLFRPPLQKAYVLGPDRIINQDRDFVYHDNGWGPYCEGVEIYEVPGNHDSMVLEPNVRVLASRIKACIQRAEAEIDAASSDQPAPTVEARVP